MYNCVHADADPVLSPACTQEIHIHTSLIPAAGEMPRTISTRRASVVIMDPAAPAGPEVGKGTSTRRASVMLTDGSGSNSNNAMQSHLMAPDGSFQGMPDPPQGASFNKRRSTGRSSIRMDAVPDGVVDPIQVVPPEQGVPAGYVPHAASQPPADAALQQQASRASASGDVGAMAIPTQPRAPTHKPNGRRSSHLYDGHSMVYPTSADTLQPQPPAGGRSGSRRGSMNSGHVGGWSNKSHDSDNSLAIMQELISNPDALMPTPPDGSPGTGSMRRHNVKV